MSEQPAVAVIVVAAGSGARLGAPEPKAFVAVAGRTILAHALEPVFALAEPAQVVVVAPTSHLNKARDIAAEVAGPASGFVTVVAGGATRQDSVAAGLREVEASVRIVLVHDAARAFTPPTVFAAVIDAVRSGDRGIVPGLPVTDTIKRTDAEGAVQETLDRSRLVAVQTPQGFPRATLTAAYSTAVEAFTDDAALVAAAGYPVSAIAGDPLAFKITTPWDLRRAESLAGVGEAQTLRTGIGIDVHAFDDTRPLWLGGLHWPHEPGLAGHSDGDAVAHAICDALLSAAGLGDIGGTFGTDDERMTGAHGDVFIRETVRLLARAGFTARNVAVQVLANRPKLAHRRADLEAHLSGLVGAPVSVAATTTDGLGFAGRGEGVTAIATALVGRTP